MMRHEGLDANSFSNNAQGIAKREFRVERRRRLARRPDPARTSCSSSAAITGCATTRNRRTLLTVPTALERVGNFSQTFIRDENGNPVPARIFDPFNVVQEGPDLYRRVEIPNAIIPNPNPSRRCRCTATTRCRTARRTTCTTRTTSRRRTMQTVRRHSSNNRVDCRLASTRSTRSGGISYATITHAAARSARRRSTAPPASAATRIRTSRSATRSCRQPDVVVDVRYGADRINTKNVHRQQGRVHRLPAPSASRPTCSRSWPSRARAGRQSQRLQRRQRRRQQLVGAVGRHVRHQASRCRRTTA